jgi:hypothetical protein
MKILCIGDSWTKGYGIDNPDQTWPYVLQSLTNHDVTVCAEHGARNDEISIWCEEQLNGNSYDLILIGWSGISRNPGWSLSYAPDEEVDSPDRERFFRTRSLKNLQNNWLIQRRRIEILARTSTVIHFSVFGDDPSPDRFQLQSFLEFLANQEGIYFKYSIPIFEFDFLNERNIVTKEFAKRNFKPDWEHACVERELVRMREEKTLFLDCGHPSHQGHEQWAEYVKSTLNL